MIEAKVLIVDDEENNLLILEDELEFAGYQTLSARNGAEALRILYESGDIDLVVLDRMMPGMNGTEVIAQMKQDSALARIPVIIQSAAAEQHQVAEGLSSGAFAYLTKPFEIGALLAHITEALEGSLCPA